MTHTRRFILILLLATTALLCTGCLYRMPEEGECSLIPTTNNPEIVRDGGPSWMPAVPY